MAWKGTFRFLILEDGFCEMTIFCDSSRDPTWSLLVRSHQQHLKLSQEPTIPEDRSAELPGE